MSSKVIIGIDLGGMSAKFGLFDLDGKLLYKSFIKTSKNDGYEKTLNDIVNEVLRILEENNYKQSDLIKIGIGVPAPVLEDGTVPLIANLNWEKVNVKLFLEEKLNVPIFIANDANVAVLAEQKQGAAKGFKNVALFTIGTGIGGGIIIDDKLFVGRKGMGGELGHMPILNSDSKFTCGCGGKRCLELVASSTAMMRMAKEFSETDKRFVDISTKEIFDLAKQGDKLATKIVDECVNYLASAAATISTVYVPDCFIFGGGVSNAGEFLRKKIEDKYNELVFAPAKGTKIVLAQLGNDAGIIGAAYLK